MVMSTQERDQRTAVCHAILARARASFVYGSLDLSRSARKPDTPRRCGLRADFVGPTGKLRDRIERQIRLEIGTSCAEPAHLGTKGHKPRPMNSLRRRLCAERRNGSRAGRVSITKCRGRIRRIVGRMCDESKRGPHGRRPFSGTRGLDRGERAPPRTSARYTDRCTRRVRVNVTSGPSGRSAQSM